MHSEWAWLEPYLLLVGFVFVLMFVSVGIAEILADKRHKRRMRESELED